VTTTYKTLGQLDPLAATLTAGDKLRAYATLGTLSFNAFGAELS
jgi:hypothetical protein